ncbi:MAG: tetratricopeptide repeat protein [Betaproteobacteria bacterium]
MSANADAALSAKLGWQLLHSGNARDAELKFRAALGLDANSVEALHGLAIIAHQTGNFQPALALFDRALNLDGENSALHVNRGNTLAAMQKHDDAVAAFQRALEISPALASALVNLATAQHALGRLDEAVATMEQAVAAQPQWAEALNNLGNFYKDQGRLDMAVDCYERALQVNPLLQQAFSNKLAALKLDQRIKPAEILRKHREWSRWFEAVSMSAPLLQNSAEPGRRLRIGYVSPDCHTAVPAFIDHVIAAHDREKFEVYCYFNNPQAPEKPGALNIAESTRIMRGHDDAAVAQMIHRDGIDILIDIAGHTGHNRLGVFARRPAPVQITWLDYLCSTGLDAIDYRITDAVADPPGSEQFHSEKLLRMAEGTQWCWQPPADSPEVAPTPCVRNGHITFGSFNNAQKLTDATLDLWRRLLAAIPDARMCVAGIPEGVARARVLVGLACDESRVKFLPRMSVLDYRRAFDTVDVMLDPMPFSGATTTLDALWQGVPVLTLPGATSCSRSSASLLTALDLREWIATNADDFIVRGRQLATNTPALYALRESLRGRLRASSILDTRKFTRHLENLYRQAWTDWCEERTSAAGRPDKMAGSHDALVAATAYLKVGRTGDALALLVPLMKLRPHWDAAKRELARAAMAWAREHPEEKAAWGIPISEIKSRARVSAIICSIRPDYFAHISQQLTAQFAAHEFELIGIHDARSLCEAYNRGAQQARGDILIFCHDDIDIVHADFGERVLHHLATNDVIGVAGASRLIDADWGHAGLPYVHGQVIHRPPGQSGYLYFCAGLQDAVVNNIQALDGVFIALHRRVWEHVRFDDATFDGFHVYDIDFTYRAQQAGFRLAVAMDLLLVHFSTGGYDLKWQFFNRRFLAKFPEMSGLPNPKRHSNLQVKLPSLSEVEQLHTGLFHHNFGAFDTEDPEDTEKKNP